ncbi:MAG: LD-carboxypeptidase [Flammeovirgaceae bacterium]
MNYRRKFLRLIGKSVITSSILAPLSACITTQSNASFLNKNTPKTLKANKLKKGDLVGIVAPAGNVLKKDAVEDFRKLLENLGFSVLLGKHIFEEYGDLAGKDEARAEDINQMFYNQDVRGIFSIRGGWGSARILHLIDYKNILANPKVLMGYSDISALLVAVYAKTGLITFHGPMGYDNWDEITTDYFSNLVIQNQRLIFKNPPTFEGQLTTIYEGETNGILIGGNMSVLSAIIGSEYLPNWKNKILFLEEVSEETYRIDRMLTQFKLAGILEKINGFVFGQCKNCNPDDPDHSFTFMQVMADHIIPLKIPSFTGAMFGHIANKFTLPIGANVKINAKEGYISLEENALI